jgi:hypothetical protein
MIKSLVLYLKEGQFRQNVEIEVDGHTFEVDKPI